MLCEIGYYSIFLVIILNLEGFREQTRNQSLLTTSARNRIHYVILTTI